MSKNPEEVLPFLITGLGFVLAMVIPKVLEMKIKNISKMCILIVFFLYNYTNIH